MAEEINLIVNVEGSGEGKRTIADVRKEIIETKKEAEGLGTKLNEGINQAETKTVSLKAQLRAMKVELLSLDEGSAEFKKLSRDAAELEDKIGDVNARVKALSSDTKRLDALIGVGTGIAGAFQAAQGAMALFGSDSKKVEEAIKNIIAVQGILNGVQTIANLLQKEHIVGQYARTAVDKTGAAFTKIWTAVQWGFNAAVAAAALPITLIVAGVTALATGVYFLVKGLKDGTIGIKEITAVLWRIIMPLQLIVDLFNKIGQESNSTESILQRNSKKNTERFNKEVSEIKEKRRLEQEAFNNKQTQFDLDIARAEAEGKSVQKLKELKLQAILDEKKAIYQANIDIVNATIKRYEIEAQLRGKSLDEFLKSVGINKEATEKSLREQLTFQEQAIFSAETDVIAIKNTSNKKQVDDTKKKIEEQIEAERQRLINLQEQENDYFAQLEKAETDFFDSKLSKRDKELQDVTDYYFDLIERGKQFGADTAILEEAQREQQLEINSRYDQLEADAKIAELKRVDDEQKKLDEQQRAIQESKFKSAQNFAKASIDLAQTVFTITNKLGKQDEESRTKRAKRQFELSKTLSIAEATISTINGVVNALSEKSILPAPFSTILRASNAIAIAAAGAANVAKIASQSFEGGGGGADTSLGGGDVSASLGSLSSAEPQVNPVQSGSTLLNQEPQKVYVVESDITNVQKKVSAIEAEATF
jgi:hypothetical protein